MAFGIATGNTVRVRWLNRQGVVFFTEALITCGDKTACDTQLSRSRHRRRRLAKKRSGDLHMGEVAERNDKEVGGGATRRRDPNTSSKRSPPRSERLIGSRSLRRNIHCLFRHVRLRARRRRNKAKRRRRVFSRRTLTDAAAVDWRGSAGAPLLQVDKSATADKHS